MGIFPEDHNIRVSRLIKLWVTEGFLKPNKSHSLEEVAEDYICDLVDRNLISIRKLGSTGKIKTCNIHDLLRDACLRIGMRENFLRVVRKADSAQGLDNAHRIVFYESIPKSDHDHPVFHTLRSAHLIRSFICEGGQLPHRFKLLRVLSSVDDDSLETIFRQVNLRHLAYEHLLLSYSRLPLSVSLLWNLQTLIIRGSIQRILAPRELWAMLNLRHVEIDKLCLPDPPHGQGDVTALPNLRTLTEIMNFRWSTESCSKVPNVKKLHMHVTKWIDSVENLEFPNSLVKLTLKGSRLQWEDLSVTGPEWKPVEGEFVRLKVLKIHCGELSCWDADSCHFPVLEELVLVDMYALRGIPFGIGEIDTLKVIRLYYCGEPAVMSALSIVEEQEKMGNEGLRVRVVFWDEDSLERFRSRGV
ncbi:disease resistance protein [Striga asiatica]|uniref:Disease resistance protein n=1 Tax=Striga asiatica TaxID=4170 RepID=A0A5A7P2W4_STRAF|nr:disease resistance protein [Striga asiatica]